MWALIAFIGMAVLILTLIEINERYKKKENEPEKCKEEQACSDCSLIDICDKEEKKSPRKK